MGRDETLAGLERDGPVNDYFISAEEHTDSDARRTVQIKIGRSELFKSFIELFHDLLGLMGRVPKLRRHEKLFALDDTRNDFLQSRTNFILILVDHGKIKMAISIPNGVFDLFAKSTD